MRFGIFVFSFLCSILLLAFVTSNNHKSSETGCAGSKCHQYLPGFIRLENVENLKLKVVPDFKVKNTAISAELLNDQGQIVDFQETTYQKQFVLNAPRAGRYKVLVGYQMSRLYWDSLTVDVTNSTISIPTPRYGTSTFDFFPVHPRTVQDSAVLRFILPHDSEVEILLYTAAGKLVRRILKENLSAGMHELGWEAKDDLRRGLPAGKYLCELRSGRKKLVQPVYVKR